MQLGWNVKVCANHNPFHKAYVIAVLDDENSNDKMDYALMMPKEGFGFSNFYLTGLSRPKFEQFKFLVGDANFSVVIRMKYI